MSVVELQSALFMGTMSCPRSLNSEWQRQRISSLSRDQFTVKQPPTTETGYSGHDGSSITTRDTAVGNGPAFGVSSTVHPV